MPRFSLTSWADLLIWSCVSSSWASFDTHVDWAGIRSLMCDMLFANYNSIRWETCESSGACRPSLALGVHTLSVPQSTCMSCMGLRRTRPVCSSSHIYQAGEEEFLFLFWCLFTTSVMIPFLSVKHNRKKSLPHISWNLYKRMPDADGCCCFCVCMSCRHVVHIHRWSAHGITSKDPNHSSRQRVSCISHQTPVGPGSLYDESVKDDRLT